MKMKLIFVVLAAFIFVSCGKTKENYGDSGNSKKRTGQTHMGSMPYIVDFSATWCRPCQQLKPYFKQMEETYAGQARFRTVDVDENPELAGAHNLNGVPTVIFFSDSTMTHELRRIVGFDPQGIEDAIVEYI